MPHFDIARIPIWLALVVCLLLLGGLGYWAKTTQVAGEALSTTIEVTSAETDAGQQAAAQDIVGFDHIVLRTRPEIPEGLSNIDNPNVPAHLMDTIAGFLNDRDGPVDQVGDVVLIGLEDDADSPRALLYDMTEGKSYIVARGERAAGHEIVSIEGVTVTLRNLKDKTVKSLSLEDDKELPAVSYEPPATDERTRVTPPGVDDRRNERSNRIRSSDQLRDRDLQERERRRREIEAMPVQPGGRESAQ
jgi:hypothetical protein